MNAKTAFKGEKEDERLLLKKWARLNGNGSAAHNNNYQPSPIIYKTEPIGKRLCFSIGDNWAERIGKKVYSYKIISVEDIIIPAGVYKCYKVIEELKGGADNYYWFAPDVGLVKWEVGEIKGVLQDCVKENGAEQERV